MARDAGDRMRVLAWIRDAGWEACADAAATLGGDVTLAVTDPELAPAGGLLGRHRPRPRHRERIEAVVAEAGDALLDAAAERLGRDAERLAVHGHAEHALCEAAKDFDVLVVARDELHSGPKSLRPPTRFVVDHAPCAVLLVWPGDPPPPKKPKHPGP